MNRSANRVNLRRLGLLLAIAVAAAVGVFVVHRIQVDRNAGGLARLARARLEEGKENEAIGLFARYLQHRPNDAAAMAEFARLVVAKAERPDATREQVGHAYAMLEAAVRKNPDDAALRRQLVEWMLRFARFGDALTEIEVLRDQAPGQTAGSAAMEQPDSGVVEVMRAFALNGRGDYKEAAETSAAIVGFDLETRSFPGGDAAPTEETSEASARVMREASTLLASLLADRFADPAAAACVLERLTATHPHDFRAWLTLSRWRQSKGDFAGAGAAVRRAAELAPDEPDVLFMNLELALAEQRLDEAERIAAKAREIFPDDDRSFRGQASVALLRRAPERAVAALREGLSQMPQRPSLLLMLTDILLQSNRLEEAEETIATLGKRQGPNAPAAGMLEARLLIAQKRWLPAKQKLDAVRPLVAGSDELTKQVDLLLGQCHEMLGQFDEQLAANQRVLRDDGGSLAARIGSAAALAATGKPDAALAEYESIASAIDPDRLGTMPQVWGPLLQLLVTRETKRATDDRDWSRVESVVESLERSPALSAAQLAALRADLLVRQGQPQAAIDLLRTTIEADRSDPQPLAALIQLTLRQNGPEAARELLAQAPAALRDHPFLLLARVQVAAREPAAASAAELAELEAKAEGLPADDALRLLAAIATVHRAAGEAAEAERIWRRAAEKRPDDLGIRGALFELACEAGDVERAHLAAAEIARLAGPTSPQARVSAAAALILNVRSQRAKATADRGPAAGDGVDAPPLTGSQAAQLTEARHLLIEAENDRPGWAQVQQLFAEIAGMQGDVPTAIERLQQAVRMGPANPAVVRQLAALLYRANRLDEAEKALDLVGPDGLGGLERLSAELELKSGQFDEAVAVAERSLAGGRPMSAADLLWFGQMLARAGKVDRAGVVLEQAVEADPRQPAAWLALFSAQLAAGHRRTAEKTLEKAGEGLASPQRELVVAQGYETLGRLDEAERSFRDAATAGASDPNVTQSLAAFLLRRGRLAEAREQLAAIIASGSGASAGAASRRWARRTLAEMTAGSGGFKGVEQALAILDGNVDENGKLPPEDVALKIGLLAARPEPRCWKQALELIASLSASQPLTTNLRVEKARLLEQLDRWSECRDELLALASASNAPPAFLAVLVEKLIKHGELEAAGIWLKTLASRVPDAPAVLVLQSQLSAALNDRPAALAAARKLIPTSDTRPESAGQLAILGTLFEQLGFASAADEVFSRYAAVSTDGVLARSAFLARKARGDEALDLLESSWERIPLESLLRQAVSVVAALQGSVTPAQKARVEHWFARALREDPDSPAISLLEADFVGLTGNPEEVVSRYRALLAREDLLPAQTAVVSNNLAFQLAAPGTVAEAEKLVASAIEVLGPHPDILDTRGLVLLEAGKARESLADFREAILVPSASKYLHFAAALASDQQVEAARRALAEAKKLGLAPRQLTPRDRERLRALEASLGS